MKRKRWIWETLALLRLEASILRGTQYSKVWAAISQLSSPCTGVIHYITSYSLQSNKAPKSTAQTKWIKCKPLEKTLHQPVGLSSSNSSQSLCSRWKSRTFQRTTRACLIRTCLTCRTRPSMSLRTTMMLRRTRKTTRWCLLRTWTDKLKRNRYKSMTETWWAPWAMITSKGVEIVIFTTTKCPKTTYHPCRRPRVMW